MSRSLSRIRSCIRATAALGAVAIMVAGCAAANNATTSQATGQGEQPYKTAYGLSSDGPTTDLYTELFGSRRRDDQVAAASAAATTETQPVQPATTVAGTQPVQPAATAATRQGKPASAAASSRQAQPLPAPVQVAQQPAAPPPPPEPDVPTAYGITANGPTTDLYTELFGPRRRDGQ